MSDPFTSIVVLLKPYNAVLTAGLFIIILSELVLSRSDIIRSKVIKQKAQFSRKYDDNFLNFIIILRSHLLMQVCLKRIPILFVRWLIS